MCRYATILAFDVKVDAEAKKMAEEMGVKIFTADIIYHLFDSFTGYLAEVAQERREALKNVAIFPSVCRVRHRTT
jgi:translation initiation factor 5B